MNPILEYMTGMNTLTDQVVAMDMLTSAKSGVRNYAMAVTECATPEVKAVLAKQLEEAVDLHHTIADYMAKSGYYYPHDVNRQIQLDQQNINAALNIPY